MGPYEASQRASAVEIRQRLCSGVEPTAPARKRTIYLVAPTPPSSPKPAEVLPTYRPRVKYTRRSRQQKQKAPEPITVSDPPVTTGAAIISDVCAKYRLTRAQLTDGSRVAHHVAARQEAAFRMVVRARYTYAKAARLLGYRDHTTAYYAVDRVAATSAELTAELEAYRISKLDEIERRRVEGIRLHFEEGHSAKYISKVLAVSYAKLVRWLTAEADRRRLAA